MHHLELDLPSQTHVTERPAHTRLSAVALFVLVANGLATLLAVTLNWPSQFGGVVGTDAGREWLSRGTAISAPLAPITCLVVMAILVRLRSWAGWVGIGLTFLTSVLVLVGGMGELVAEPTADVSRAVLVAAGVGWAVVAAVFVVLGIAAARERRAILER